MAIAVLGGGLGGLSATYYLLKKCPNQAITLIESTKRLGGWIKSRNLQNNILFEQGPRTIRPIGPAAMETLSLIEELGVADKVIPIYKTDAVARKRMIYVNGKLNVLPNSLGSLFKRQDPFSKPLIMYLLRDLFASKKNVKDETIYEFVERRFGNEVADYLISALICGICAGDSKQISVNFLLKNFFDYEQKYGTILGGILRNIFKFKNVNEIKVSNLSIRSKKEKWAAYSFKNGIETLTKTLESNIKKSNKINFEMGSKCIDIEFFLDSAILQLEGGKHISCKHIISALSAETLGTILQKQHPRLSELLEKIQAVNVAVINLQYGKQLNIDEGFGFLVPPKENLPILGVTYDSFCFPCENNTVLTVMMGGKWFESLFGNKPDEMLLLNIAKEQLRIILGITDEPNLVKVNVLNKCIPQYVVGHNENIQKINQYIRKHKLELSLCGSSYYGVGVNDVIVSAKKAVNSL